LTALSRIDEVTFKVTKIVNNDAIRQAAHDFLYTGISVLHRFHDIIIILSRGLAIAEGPRALYVS